MTGHLREIVLGTALIVLLSASAALAETCGLDGPDDSCTACTSSGAGDYIQIGGVVEDLSDSEESFDQLGIYPEAWLTSGRLHFPDNGFARNRFEVRWEDISGDMGRGWARLSIWPATLTFNGWLTEKNAWNQYTDRDLQHEELSFANLRLRFHQGEADNMALSFETREFRRDGTAPLREFSLQRLQYNYNFNLGCDRVRGTIRHSATAIDAPRTGTSSGEIDSSMLRIDADVSDRLRLFGKGAYTAYNYENLPDSEMTGTDYTLGFNYQAGYNWELSGDYRAKEYPTDNTVSSHVEGLDSYGAQLTYRYGCGNRIEAGYGHQTVDYAQLEIQDPTVSALIRGTTQVTPADVSAATNLLSPEQDNVWAAVHWNVTDRLRTDTRYSYTEGDPVRTDLVGTGATSLFYDEVQKHSSNWYFDLTSRDTLSLLYSAQESSNTERARDFELRYIEGAWTRNTGGDNFLTFGVSTTDATLDLGGTSSDYAADDITYLAAYDGSCPCFNYGLNLAMTDGSGSEDYGQVAVGADLRVKRLGPLDIRLDWFDREDTNYPGFDSQALEIGVSYRIDF
ncbi:hypothetical protein JW859_14465 [bacterium]|nr:hypothetical protein [bacterium]